MELAKITSKGQITIPIAIRKALALADGGKVAFIEHNGQYFLANPAKLAFQDIQNSFSGEAERLGLEDIDDVASLVKEFRKERSGRI